MRICLFTDSFVPFCSGVTYAVINQMREMGRRGHEVTIFRGAPWSYRCEETPPMPDSVRVVSLPLSFPVPKFQGLYLAVPTFLTTLIRLMRSRPDVIHVTTEGGCGWEGVAAAKALGVPLVGTFHTFFADPSYMKTAGVPAHPALQRLLCRYQSFFFGQCDAILTPSLAARQYLLRHGVRRDPLVVSNGIPAPEASACRAAAEVRAQFGIGPDAAPVFLYVGRLSEEKSLDVLVQTFARVAPRLPGARLVFVGDGPYRGALERVLRECQVRHLTTLTGYIPHEELITRGILRLGDVFVTASKTENQPVSLLEAMAFGLPIIAPAAKGIPELVTDEESGLLFPPDDVQAAASCMERLGRDVELRERLAAATREHAHLHSVAGVADRLEDVYAQVTAARKVRRGRPRAREDTPTAAARPTRARSARWSSAGGGRHSGTVAAVARRDS